MKCNGQLNLSVVRYTDSLAITNRIPSGKLLGYFHSPAPRAFIRAFSVTGSLPLPVLYPSPPPRSGYCPVSTQAVIICDACEPRIQTNLLRVADSFVLSDCTPEPDKTARQQNWSANIFLAEAGLIDLANCFLEWKRHQVQTASGLAL